MRALRARQLFDGLDLVADPVVAVEGSTVVAVGSAVPRDVEVEDLGEVTLLPGLIDTHQHLCFDGGGTLEEQVVTVSDGDLSRRARANAGRALRAGITTIRDLGDRSFVTLALRDDPTLPTILASGPPLTPPGGHCWFLEGCCEGTEALVAAVDERKRRSCDVVKIMVTGGALTPTFPMWESQFTPAEVLAVVQRAHELGLPVAAHCHGVDGIAMAIEAGVDTIEHCSFFTSERRSVPDHDVMAAIARSGIPVSATLGLLPDYLPPPVIVANIPAIRAARMTLRELGATLVVGTDAGINAGKPHDVLPHAVANLLDMGITGGELLATLTSTAAGACGVGHAKGRLAPGYDADILAVAGDAIATPEALHDVVGVWRAGARVPR